MPQIQLPATFFKKERDTVYSDWNLELFRELFQNSLDAGSTKIDIQVSRENDKTCVVFADNGCGMSREILEKVYFRLGESTKDGDDDSIGGFGRARILTNFSMDSYSIRTQNNLVLGSGADYDVIDNPWTEGCVQTLLTSDASVFDLSYSCENFLNTCDIKVPVLLNGEKVELRLSVSGRKVKDLHYSEEKFAELFYLPKSEASMRGYAVVRVNGCAMFTKYLGCEGSVVIEIDADKSRKVLTASRGEFKKGYSTFLDTLLREFINNEEEASRRNVLDELRTFLGRGVFVASRKKTDKAEAKKTRKSYGPGYPGREVELYARGLVDAKFLGKELPAFCAGVKEATIENKTSYYEATLGDFLPNLVVHTKTADRDLIRLSKIWNIKEWKFKIKENTVDWGEHRDKISLLFVWEEACRIAIEELLEFKSLDINWCPGFVLSEYMKASHQVKNEVHVLLLNPYNAAKAMKYNLRSEASLMEILACAKHEVAHIAYSDHNEWFAMTLSNIDSTLHQGEALARMKQVRLV